MKKTTIFLLLSIVFFLFSCSKRTPLQQLIHEADVVKVFIYSSSGATSVHYETNDIDKVKLWSSYIAETSDGSTSCDNYEGKLIFKVYEDSTIMKFSLKEGCQQVAYQLNDSSFVKKLTKDGIDFLNGLKKIE